MNEKELEEKLRIISLTTAEAIANARGLELELRTLQKEVQSIKATQPYLIKRIGELTKNLKSKTLYTRL